MSLPSGLCGIAAPPQTASPAVEPKLWGRRTGIDLALILLAGIVVRVPFFVAFRPISSGDTASYSGFYFFLTHHLFLFGGRAPVYPLFLGLAQWLVGVPPQIQLGLLAGYSVVLLQAELGILSGALFYLALRILQLRERNALAASLFFVTIPAICMFEMNILNMALSCSLMVLTAALFLLTMKRLQAGESVVAVSLATGVALSLSVLNRPDLLIFAILLLAVMVAALVRARRTKAFPVPTGWQSLALIALPLICSVLAWMTLMYIGIGQFRITTFDRLNRSRTVYNLFDRVDPEDSVLGGIMARTYKDEVARNTETNRREIIWQAYGELAANYWNYPIRDTATDPAFLDHALIQQGRRVLGLIEIPCEVRQAEFCWEAMRRKIDFYDYIGHVSWKLARKYPADWLRNVTFNFFEESFDLRYNHEKPAVEGFQAQSGDGADVARTGSLSTLAGKAINKAIELEAPMLALLYFVTLVFFCCAPWVLMRAPDQHWMGDMAVLALAAASVGTIVGTCVLAGLNRVYTLPHLAVFTLVAAYAWEHRSRIAARLLRRRGENV